MTIRFVFLFHLLFIPTWVFGYRFSVAIRKMRKRGAVGETGFSHFTSPRHSPAQQATRFLSLGKGGYQSLLKLGYRCGKDAALNLEQVKSVLFSPSPLSPHPHSLAIGFRLT